MSRKKRNTNVSFTKTAAPDRLLSMAIMVLLACMALPSAVKFNHAIYEHKDLHCNSEALTHFHASEFDCVFHKFKVTTSFYPPLFVLKIYMPQEYVPYEFVAYGFVYSIQQLPYALRAPPNYS
jgi:hypothetical protein